LEEGHGRELNEGGIQGLQKRERKRMGKEGQMRWKRRKERKGK